MSVTERMSAIHIDPAAANNRGDGSTAGTAWRDWEELTRRLGRGTACFKQPTTITIHGSLSTSDSLNLHAAVGSAGLLSIEGDRGTPVLTGTFSAKTDFVGGSQAQQVTGTGLGSHVGAGKQLVITASGTSSHVGAVARIAKSISGDNVRTTPFSVPRIDGTLMTIGVADAILPSVGDSFAVYAIPSVPVGTISLEEASNVNSISSGSGTGFSRFQNISFIGAATAPGSTADIDASTTRHLFIGCDIRWLRVCTHSAQLQASLIDTMYFSGSGSSQHWFTLKRDTRTNTTQVFNSHYMDVQHMLGQGGAGGITALPYCYSGSTLIMYYAEGYDSTSGLNVNPNGLTIAEQYLWGSGNTYGVTIFSSGKLYRLGTAAGGIVTITGSSGDIRAYTQSSSIVKSWSDGFFVDAFGTGVVSL